MNNERKKILFTANLDTFFVKFLIPQLEYFSNKGYEIHVASKNENINIPYCDKKFDVCFARNLKIFQNIDSYKQIKKILTNNHYDIISCHTPFGGAITRLAAKNCHLKNTKIVYMAHGFHFYKGAPLINWLLYYPVEKYLANFTDAIITINSEDFENASKNFNTRTHMVQGVGINSKKFDIELSEKEKSDLRSSLKISKNDFVMIFSGEISNNKNQKLLIDVIKKLKKQIPNAVLLLAGNDLLHGELKTYVKELKLENSVKFLGYRKDIPELLKISNLALSSSKREGLPINIIEAMYVGLPIVATNCRGNRDVIIDGKNGYIISKNSVDEFSSKIYQIYCDKKLYNEFSKFSKSMAQKYLIDETLKQIIKVYED